MLIKLSDLRGLFKPNRFCDPLALCWAAFPSNLCLLPAASAGKGHKFTLVLFLTRDVHQIGKLSHVCVVSLCPRETVPTATGEEAGAVQCLEMSRSQARV